MATQIRSLLLVEDQPADQGWIVRFLNSIDPPPRQILVSAHLEESLRLVRQTDDLDCVVLDYLLGENNGLDLLATIREEGFDVPVITLTGFGDSRIAVQAMKLGAQDFLPKEDINPDLLSRAIFGAIHTVELERELAQKQLDLKRLAEELKQANARLEELSRIDDLTRVHNRRDFNSVLEQECRRSSRSGPVSLLMIDVDCFKAFNDTYGHVEGDECFNRIAEALRLSARRATDFVARYGGEEFAIILPGTDSQAAHELAEAIRQKIEHLHIRHERSDVCPYVTVSIGVATSQAHPDSLHPEDLLRAADQALYLAKERGRNRVRSA